jgi:hypothetical protein
LWKFYNFYKDWVSKRKDRGKRFSAAMEKYEEQLLEALKEHGFPDDVIQQCGRFENECYRYWSEHFATIMKEETYKNRGEVKTREVTLEKILQRIRDRRDQSIRINQSSEKIDNEKPPTLETLKPDRYIIPPGDEKYFGDDTKEAEREYYGFQWIHDLEESPDYDGYTIERFDQAINEVDDPFFAMEVQILSVTRKDFANGKGHCWDAKVDDANGKEIIVRFWADDYERFKDDLIVGQLCRMQVKPPVGNFPAYSFYAPPRHERYKLPKSKDLDWRLVVLRRGNPVPKKPVIAVPQALEGFQLNF